MFQIFARRQAHGRDFRSSFLAAALLVMMGAASCLSAQPVLHLADTYRGMPFSAAFDIVLSPDQAFLYSGSGAGLSVLRRGDGGEHELITTYLTGEDGEPVASHFVLSAEGSHLYALAGTDVLVVFDRDFRTGLLEESQVVSSTEDFSLDSAGHRQLVLSPLGDYLYVGLRTQRAQRFLVFERTPATGRLTFIQELETPQDDDSTRMWGLLVSPSGDHLYALGDPAVTILARDTVSGRLSFVESIDGINGAEETLVRTWSGAFTADGSGLYLVGTNPCYNSCLRQAVAVMRRDPLSGGLELVELVPETLGTGLGDLILSPDERHLYLADRESSRARILSFERDAGSGRLELLGDVQAPGESLSGVAALAFEAGGQGLYASNFWHAALPMLERDPVTGVLSYDHPGGVPDGIGDSRDVAVSPTDGRLFVTDFRRQSLSSFDWDESLGALQPGAAVAYTDPGLGGLRGYTDIRVAPDGSRLYAFSEWNYLMTFALDSGGLELVSEFHVGGWEFEISPDGAHLYTFGESALVLARDSASDEFSEVQVFDEVLYMFAPTFSPDGRFLYALAPGACVPTFSCFEIVILERDPTSGLLSLRGSVSSAGPNPFESARRIVVSPDGAHLYVTSVQDGRFALSGFTRDLTNGSLDFIETVDEGEAPEPYYPGNRDLAISPDGRHLYAVRREREDLTVHERDPETGVLTRLQTVDVADALVVEVSEDSQRVYVAGANKVTTFSRGCLTGDGLCLNQDRFRIDLEWRSFDGTVGSGRVVPLGSDETGLLWFFQADNWEMMIKVLDGCGINARFWVFAGATTTVEYTLRVTDTVTGIVRRYFNPLGHRAAAITDTDAFATCSARLSGSSELVQSPSRTPMSADWSVSTGVAQAEACTPSPTRLCLNDGRFSIEVGWRDYAGNTGSGKVVPGQSVDSGLLWFFHPQNWEVLIKVLNGCEINGQYWMLAAATTDVEYTLRVIDTRTGVFRDYTNPLGTAAPALVDTFATCP